MRRIDKIPVGRLGGSRCFADEKRRRTFQFLRLGSSHRNGATTESFGISMLGPLGYLEGDLPLRWKIKTFEAPPFTAVFTGSH